MSATEETLRVTDLRTHFFTRAGVAKAVDGVSFRVGQGEIMGLVGESGSGKSMTGLSLLNLVDPPGRIVSGQVLLKGQDVLQLPADQWRRLRGNRIAMIFQDPMMSFNPVLRIDTQMTEALLAHRRIGRAQARDRARSALKRVGIAAPEERLLAYPHELSGGMRQRVAIAIALLNEPDLIICDEPTTALDVTIQGQILYEMQKLCREMGVALLWITHDLSVVAGLADTVAVMYAGRIVESGTTEEVLRTPRHPYTHGLIASSPAASSRKKGEDRALLDPIPGVTPGLLDLPTGCPFRVRCPRASPACLIEPPVVVGPSGRTLRCFHPYEHRGQP